MRKKGNYFGILLLILMSVSILALLTAKPATTGMAVQEIESEAVPEPQKPKQGCFGGVDHGNCIATKPLYCDDGQLIYNCNECGCNPGESCGAFGVCEVLDICADGSFFGECSTHLNGKFCEEGHLVDYCELCGCEEGYSCNNNKCVPK